MYYISAVKSIERNKSTFDEGCMWNYNSVKLQQYPTVI